MDRVVGPKPVLPLILKAWWWVLKKFSATTAPAPTVSVRHRHSEAMGAMLESDAMQSGPCAAPVTS